MTSNFAGFRYQASLPAISLYLFTQSWLSRSGSITASPTIYFGIFIGVSFVSVFKKVTILVLSCQRKSILKIQLWNIVLIQVTYQIFCFFLAIWISSFLSFSLLLTIQLRFLSPIQYFRDLAHLSALYPLSISFFIEIDILPLLIHFPMISRCNIYLGIFFVEDSQKNAVDMVLPINKIHSGKRRVCPDFEKLHKKFIYDNASEKFILLSDLGTLLKHFFLEITISPEYLLLSSVVFEKINNFDFFSKNVFFNKTKLFTRSQTWRICSPYYQQSTKRKKFKDGLFEKIHF